jgi:hypothetical protein
MFFALSWHLLSVWHVPMDWYTHLKNCKDKHGFTDYEIAELTGTSHTQVRRWRNWEALPTGPQDAIIKAVDDWLDGNALAGKNHLLRIAQRRGHYSLLETIFC